MRLSELARKEIVNLADGRRLGPAGDAELVLDPVSGRIEELWVPVRGRLFLSRRVLAVAWEEVRRIGPEVIIVEVDPEAGGEGRGDRRPLRGEARRAEKPKA